MNTLAMIVFLAAAPISGQAGNESLQTGRAEAATGTKRAVRLNDACGNRPFAACADEGQNSVSSPGKAHDAINTLALARLSALSIDATFSKVGDVLPVVSGLNVPPLLQPNAIPPVNTGDVVGAFRFLCGPGQLRYDDPIVYPGKPGAAHLHQFFGNLKADAHSTYDSLRKSGESTCQNELNRSAYWMPAMLDGKGSVVRPDFVQVYYKRRAANDPACKTSAKGCVGIPRGLRFIFGWDQTRPAEPQPENAVHTAFKCVQGWDPVTPNHKDMVEPMKVCKPGQHLYASLSSPPCWNGKDLDTTDHRGHLSDMIRNDNTNWLDACPATHPLLIPQFTMTAAYSIEVGDNPTLWSLASDHMLPAAIRRPGASFHSDYFEAWEDDIRLRWEAACIDKLLNCSDGDLGDGQIMSRGKHYPMRQIAPRLVAVPKIAERGDSHAHPEDAGDSEALVANH